MYLSTMNHAKNLLVSSLSKDCNCMSADTNFFLSAEGCPRWTLQQLVRLLFLMVILPETWWKAYPSSLVVLHITIYPKKVGKFGFCVFFLQSNPDTILFGTSHCIQFWLVNLPIVWVINIHSYYMAIWVCLKQKSHRATNCLLAIVFSIVW